MSPLMVEGILFEMEGVTAETSDTGGWGGKFVHIRVSAVSVRVGASKSGHFVGRDSLKKGVFEGVVGYHLLLIDFQLDAEQHGKNHIWILSNSFPSYAGQEGTKYRAFVYVGLLTELNIINHIAMGKVTLIPL